MATERTLELTQPLVSRVTHGGRSVLELVDKDYQPRYKLRLNGVICRAVAKVRGKAGVRRAKRARQKRARTCRQGHALLAKGA